MGIDLQQIINDPFAVNLAFFLGKVIPPRIAYPVCNFIGDWAASRRDSNVTRAIRANQWVARGANLGKKALDQAVRETLRNNVYDLYCLYHYLQNPEEAQHLIYWNDFARQVIKRPEFAGRGLMIVGIHLSGFDLLLQFIARRGFQAMVLTIPDPQGGRRIEYEMRKKTGMNLIPSSLSTLRQAVKRLEQGGIVLTGLDRPVPTPKYHPPFFGHPASIPTHYISLALQSHVPVVVMAAIRQTDGSYQILSSEPIEMKCDSDRGKEILRNAEKVLKRAEEFIRLAPQQWNVPLAVWPQLLENVPS